MRLKPRTRVLQMCAARTIATAVAAGDAEHAMAAYFALPQAKDKLRNGCSVVCGYGVSNHVLGCLSLLAKKASQLDSITVGAKRVRKSHRLLGQLERADSKAISTAMHAHGIELVVWLSALFSDDNYVAYPRVGQAKLAATRSSDC